MKKTILRSVSLALCILFLAGAMNTYTYGWICAEAGTCPDVRTGPVSQPKLEARIYSKARSKPETRIDPEARTGSTSWSYLAAHTDSKEREVLFSSDKEVFDGFTSALDQIKDRLVKGQETMHLLISDRIHAAGDPAGNSAGASAGNAAGDPSGNSADDSTGNAAEDSANSSSALLSPFLGGGWISFTMGPGPGGDLNQVAPLFTATIYEDRIETVYSDGRITDRQIHSVVEDGEGVMIRLENGQGFYAPEKDSDTLWLYGDWERRADNMFGADSMARSGEAEDSGDAGQPHLSSSAETDTADHTDTQDSADSDAADTTDTAVRDAAECFGMTAKDAAIHLKLYTYSEPIEGDYSYYTHKGESYLDGGSYISFDPNAEDLEDWWNLSISDSTVSFYGITIGTDEDKAWDILNIHGWFSYDDEYSDYEPEEGEGYAAFFGSDEFDNIKYLYIEFLNGKVDHIDFNIGVGGE